MKGSGVVYPVENYFVTLVLFVAFAVICAAAEGIVFLIDRFCSNGLEERECESWKKRR
jgi:hypothetical protein